ncbi:class I SAM-dependent methyltransferase, partial [Streptococcus suis]
LNYTQERGNRVSARQGNAYTVPRRHEEFLVAKDKPLSGSLTVGKTVPLDWFEKANGKKLMGLACGGGQQGPISAAHS